MRLGFSLAASLNKITRDFPSWTLLVRPCYHEKNFQEVAVKKVDTAPRYPIVFAKKGSSSL